MIKLFKDIELGGGFMEQVKGNDYLDVNDMNMTLLSSRTFDGYKTSLNGNLVERVVYDYEIELFIQSQGGIIVDGVYIPFNKGDINFRKPGQRVAGVMPYSCINLCFDVVGDRNTIKEKLDGYEFFGSAQKAQKNYRNSILDNIGRRIPADYCKGIDALIWRIYQNYTINSDISRLEIRSDLTRVIIKLFKAANLNNNRYKTYNVIIKRSTQFIRERYKESIRVEDVAAHVGVSTNYFQAVFKNAMGITPNNYITMLRLEQAKQLLLMTTLTIGDIAFECGFNDNVYFSYVFKKHYNMTPTEFRGL